LNKTIIHIISAFDVFGPEKTTINECKALMKLGWQCRIINIWPNKDVAINNKITQEGIPYTCIEAKKILDWGIIKQLRKIFKENENPLIHSHGYKADVYSLLASRRLKIPVTTTIHGWTSEDSKVRIYEKIQAFAWKYFDLVFCVSKAYMDVAIKKGIPSNKLQMLHNGIIVADSQSENVQASIEEFESQYNISKNDLVVGIIGRLGIEKGHNLFLEMASKVSSKIDNVKYMIVGEGAEYKSLKKLAGDLNVLDKVIFTGHIDNMASVYERMDIMAICSLREGLPNVLLEAMLNKVPVVSVKVGGVPEVIDGERGGILIGDRNPDQFARILIELIRDEGRRKELGKKGMQRIEESFTFDGRMKKVMGYYNSMLLSSGVN